MGVELSFLAHLNESGLYKASGQATGETFFKQPFVIPALVQGDTVRLSIGVVEDDPSQGEGYLQEVTLTGYSCKVAIGVEGSTPLTSVTLTVSGNRLVGSLPMNTTAIDTLFSGSETSTFDRTFELEFTDGTGTQTIKRRVTLHGELITSTTVATPSPDVSLGKAEAANLYINKQGANQIILLDQTGSNDLLLWNDNGELRSDRIS